MDDRNSKENMMKMINMAANKLGISPQELENAAKNNDTDAILSKLSKDKADKIRKAVDSGSADSILNKYFGR